MALSNAERQRRYRERCKAGQPRAPYRRPQQRSSRPRRWQDCSAKPCSTSRVSNQAWLDNLPDSLGESALADKLEAICGLDLGELENVEPPLGFGRD